MGWYGDILGIPASSRNSFHDVVIGLSPNLATTWWTTSRQAPTWRCGQHSVRRLSDQKTHDSASNRRTPRKRMQKSHIEPFSRWIWWETQGILNLRYLAVPYFATSLYQSSSNFPYLCLLRRKKRTVSGGCDPLGWNSMDWFEHLQKRSYLGERHWRWEMGSVVWFSQNDCSRPVSP